MKRATGQPSPSGPGRPEARRRPAASGLRRPALVLCPLLALLWAVSAPLADPLLPGRAANDTAPAPRDPHELRVLANEDYLAGRYEEAARGYEALLARDRNNGHVFYNLGNSYVRLGRVGMAVLNYRKAQLLLPRDGDLKANLQHARSLRKDRLEEPPASVWRTLAFWYHAMNFRGLLVVFGALNLVFWSCLLAHLFRESEWLRWAIGLSLLLGLLMGGSACLKYIETFRNPDGVLLQEETAVRAGFSHNDTVLFVLNEGAEFRILDREKGWWKIELADGKKGWIPGEAAGSVSLGLP